MIRALIAKVFPHRHWSERGESVVVISETGAPIQVMSGWICRCGEVFFTITPAGHQAIGKGGNPVIWRMTLEEKLGKRKAKP